MHFGGKEDFFITNEAFQQWLEIITLWHLTSKFWNNQEKEQIFEMYWCGPAEIYVPPEKYCLGWYVITPRKFIISDCKGVGTRWSLMFFHPKSCNDSMIIQLPRVLDFSFMDSLGVAVHHSVSPVKLSVNWSVG